MLKTLTKNARVIGLVDWHLDVERDLESDKKAMAITAPKEVIALKAYFKDLPNKPIHHRNRVIFYLIFELALKNSILSKLQLGDLDLANKKLKIGGKSKKLSSKLVKYLSQWLEARGSSEAESPLLTNFDHAKKKQTGLSSTSIYRIIKNLGSAIGMEINPRSVRQGVIQEKAYKINSAANVSAVNANTAGNSKLLSFSGFISEKSLKRYQPEPTPDQGPRVYQDLLDD